MQITFLGTRGYIKTRIKRHYRHTATLIEHAGKKIMVDCGLDWSKKVWDINPDAIIITHAHPDHAFGLKNGSPCPVYATTESWQVMHNFAIDPQLRITIHPQTSFVIGTVTFEAFTLVHSIRAPAVGYRITYNNKNIFCAHDIVSIVKQQEALQNVLLYIGDGASLVHPLIRKKDDTLFGHSPISRQLTWCKKERVPYAIFTHCGSQIVEQDARVSNKKIQHLAFERGVGAIIAYDGMRVRLD